MEKLSEKKCTPCSGDETPIPIEKAKELHKQLQEGWQREENHHLEKEFRFKNFDKPLQFVNDIGRIAEEEGHHPEIFLTWGKVKITLYTHKIDGLSENDFILADKIDQTYRDYYQEQK